MNRSIDRTDFFYGPGGFDRLGAEGRDRRRRRMDAERRSDRRCHAAGRRQPLQQHRAQGLVLLRLDLGFFVSENIEIGGLFSQQKSNLLFGGRSSAIWAAWSVDNYHGYLAFNSGDHQSKSRFYFLAGLGATRYGSLNFTTAAGTTRSIGGKLPVLHHLGSRGEDLPRQERGLEARHALDADLHQVRCHRLVVRSLLGLLRDGRLAVLEPVPVRAASLYGSRQTRGSVGGRVDARGLSAIDSTTWRIADEGEGTVRAGGKHSRAHGRHRGLRARQARGRREGGRYRQDHRAAPQGRSRREVRHRRQDDEARLRAGRGLLAHLQVLRERSGRRSATSVWPSSRTWRSTSTA